MTKDNTVDENNLSSVAMETETEKESGIEESSEDALDEAIKQLEELNDILKD